MKCLAKQNPLTGCGVLRVPELCIISVTGKVGSSQQVTRISRVVVTLVTAWKGRWGQSRRTWSGLCADHWQRGKWSLGTGACARIQGAILAVDIAQVSVVHVDPGNCEFT